MTAANLLDYELYEARRDTRLLKWLRREANRDLRYWRHSYDTGLPPDRREQLIADCKAKLGLLTWAENWQAIREPGRLPAGRPDVQAAMTDHLKMVMAAVRRIAQGYRGRDGWRCEWDLPS